MKVVGINGSPKNDGNTSILIKTVFDELEKNGIETEFIQLGGQLVHGCMACGGCGRNKDKKCVIKDDCINDIIEKMTEADGIILGSPVYYSDVSAEMKALIDRSGMTAGSNGNILKRKVAGAVIAVRRGGATHTLDTMNHYFHLMQMYMVGASYWNMAYGLQPGDVRKDEEGMNNMRNLGENMAWLIKKING